MNPHNREREGKRSMLESAMVHFRMAMLFLSESPNAFTPLKMEAIKSLVKTTRELPLDTRKALLERHLLELRKNAELPGTDENLPLVFAKDALDYGADLLQCYGEDALISVASLKPGLLELTAKNLQALKFAVARRYARELDSEINQGF